MGGRASWSCTPYPLNCSENVYDMRKHKHMRISAIKRYGLKKCFNYILATMMAMGGVCFLITLTCSILAGLGIEATSSTVELPIEYVGSLYVDREGTVYTRDITYKRLQIYDENGKFVRGWFAHGTRIVDVNIVEGIVHLIRADDKNYKYDLLGNLKNTWIDKGSYRRFRSIRPAIQRVSYSDQKHNVWQYDRRVFGGSCIVKVTPDGMEEVIVKSPAYLWIISFPIPSVLYFAIPAAIWTICRIRNRKRAGGLGKVNE